MNEYSAVIVGAPETGKTLCYIPAVCSLLERLLNMNDDNLTEGMGPLVIIMAPSASDVNQVYRQVRDCLITAQREHRDKCELVVQAYGMHKADQVEAALSGGAGILVVTPPCLSRLLDNPQRLFRKAKVKIVVVDDYDACLKRFDSHLMDRLIDEFYVNHANGDPTQLVLTSSVWTKKLLKYLKHGKNGTLFIGHYAETALYGGTNFKILFKRSKEKVSYLYDSKYIDV